MKYLQRTVRQVFFCVRLPYVIKKFEEISIVRKSDILSQLTNTIGEKYSNVTPCIYTDENSNNKINMEIDIIFFYMMNFLVILIVQ